ncbi:hypothetical protein [Methylobacterium trifolii]|uniref:GGDEF domain-containing protein n=1 Tax=Methylobacterium trifolii TaxID=1003092 RepID=A0ABQ4U151_9HYPH|nr:hypothetical protein [Methylobacterium trifolii]GJE59570.1 hypothetical protein MPOCJGCO_1666 [Methylobacterium trifolii]
MAGDVIFFAPLWRGILFHMARRRQTGPAQARRLTRPDGAFGGVLIVAFDPDCFAALFEALDGGPDGSLALFGQRLFAYRTTDGLPLVVTVSTPIAEVDAPVDEACGRAFLVGGIATLMILAGLPVLLHELECRLRRETLLVETHRALAEAGTLFRGIFENPTDHLFVHRLAPDGSFALETLERLVERMGGETGVVSDDDAGPTFRFVVSLSRGASAPAIVGAARRTASRRAGHLLLVEDVEINQNSPASSWRPPASPSTWSRTAQRQWRTAPLTSC